MQTKKRYWNRYTRLAVVILLACVVALATAYINKKYIEGKVELVRIVVAANNITPFTKLTKNNLAYREIVKSEIPEDAIYDLEEFLKEAPIYSTEIGFVMGYPIKKSLTSTAADSVFGSAIGLKEGKSYLGIGIEQVSSQLVKPGTIVDAYCYMQGKDVHSPSVVISKVEEPLLANLYVHSVKGKENENIDESSEAIIPAVVVVETSSPEQTSQLIYYQMTGKIFLVPVGAEPDKYLLGMLPEEAEEGERESLASEEEKWNRPSSQEEQEQ